MKARTFASLLLACISMWLNAQSDFELVKQRVIEELLKSPVQNERVTETMESMTEDGSWPDINYADVSNTGFQHLEHLHNMLRMSIAYRQTASMFYGDPELSALVNKSMGYWCQNDFICDNWWHNQLDTPRKLVKVLLLMDGQLDPEIREEALVISDRANLNAPGARQGGDRIKIGGVAAQRVLVLNDSLMFEDIMKVINNEIRFNTGDRGLQQDHSFHHRIHRVNNTVSYGNGYALAFTEWAMYVKDTRYAFEKEKIELLVDYYLDGISKQFIYGVYIDWGVENREISRKHPMEAQSPKILENLLMVTDYRQEEMTELILLRNGQAEPSASFCKFFWQTEHFVCQRPGFYTSVRMFSIRNKNMEQAYNSEGLKNHHKADGASFLSLRGDEYLGIWPVYDWQKIPGSTVLQKRELPPAREIQKEGSMSFVGAVTDGQYGAVGFDFISPHDGIKARKSWFFFEKEYVCLGAGIETDFTPYSVATTVNQCLMNGAVEVEDEKGYRQLSPGEHMLSGLEWAYHDHVGYIFPEPSTLYLSNQVQEGRWYDINKQRSSSKELSREEVFKLWFDHGSRPQGRLGGLRNAPMLPKDVCYQYIVVPGIDRKDIKKERGIEILVNTREMQAVRHRELGLVQLIFYRAGTVEITKNLALHMDSPGAVMLHMKKGRIDKLTVADPGRSLDRIHLEIKEKKKVSKLSVKLPSGPYAGQSVQAEAPK